MIKTFVIAAFLAFALSLPVEAQNLKKGNEAYDRGDYASAVSEWKPLAKRGVAKAQNNLAFMYRTGRGTPQHYGAAVKWFRKAAQQGLDISQHALSHMYKDGLGVKKDYIRAHLWANLAAAQGLEDAGVSRDSFAQNMSPAQIAKAQKLARECLARKYKGCD
jgi:uncharacterized protein